MILRESGFVLLYVVSAAAASAALILAPTPTLTAFLVISAAHFGWGEVVTGAERGAEQRTCAPTHCSSRSRSGW